MTRKIGSDLVELRDGKLWVEGKYEFLKIGKPQLDFSSGADVRRLIKELPAVRRRNFRCLELNCYWHHLDRDGDGKIDVSLEPLCELVAAISKNGMFPSLSVETYGVGGGQIPAGFWEAFPNAAALDSDGSPVRDDEYGYATAVPSLFDPDYVRISRSFIRDLAGKLDHAAFLWFETTVEPQYMGSRWLDYSVHAKAAYESWLAREGLAAPAFPVRFPVRRSFLTDPAWNRFRAQWLADWVNGDARAFRDIAGENALVAADYLDADEETMTRRLGDPLTFLRHLDGANIIQINWSWHNTDRHPNLKAYERVRQVMEETGRDWAVTEHMTINGTDYRVDEMEPLLNNTIANSTRFGWEFVDILPDLDDPAIAAGAVVPGAFRPAHFSVYGPGWKPKGPMAVVDEKWDYWMKKIHQLPCAPEKRGRAKKLAPQADSAIPAGLSIPDADGMMAPSP